MTPRQPPYGRMGVWAYGRMGVAAWRHVAKPDPDLSAEAFPPPQDFKRSALRKEEGVVQASLRAEPHER